MLFVANRENLQSRRLHDRIKQRFEHEFESVQKQRAEARDPGPYRVVGETDPRQFLDDTSYPAETARVEVGFQLQTTRSHEYYWFNWIEPDRGLLVGWHQDDMHDDLGEVHLQVNHQSSVVEHEPAVFIDSHPMDVVERRLKTLPAAVEAVEWHEGRPTGINSTASVVDQRSSR
jgi:hypothetical protein